MSAEPVVLELRGILQRVALQDKFDIVVARVGTTICSLKAENSALKERLKAEQASYKQQQLMLMNAAFNPDVHVVAIDGLRLPACKATLMEVSPVLEAMLSAGLQEQLRSEIKTEFPAVALRTILSALHCPTLDVYGEQPFAVLLAACKICEEWQLPAALISLAAKMTSKEAATAKPSHVDWIAALIAAKVYTAANSPNRVWQEIAEEAAGALALEPAAASAEGFKNLDISAICQVMRYVPDATIELPSIDLRPVAPDFTKTTGVPSTDADPFSVTGIEFRLGASKKNGSNMGLKVTAIQNPGKPMCHGFIVGTVTISINHPQGTTPPKHRTTKDPKACKVRGWEWSNFLPLKDVDAFLEDGLCIVKGVFKIAAEQRRYELFNRWLIDSGRIEAPLSVPAALACLRACVSGINPWDMTVVTLKEALQGRDLSSQGPKKELQVRLADAVSVETQRNTCEDVSIACKSFTRLIACSFDILHEHDWDSLCQLDAASLSQVLCDDFLQIKTEEKLFEVVIKWAQCPGRAIEMVDKIMPLVRFPLICSLTSPNPGLKTLLQASSILPALVKEALELQFTPLNKRKRADGWCTFTPQKFALIEGVLEEETVPRNMRRRLCTDDEVPCLDPAQQLYSAMFQTP